MRQPESQVSVFAVGANVVLRGNIKASIFSIQNGKFSEKDYSIWEVAAVGSEVRPEINVGDEVVLHSQPQVGAFIKENTTSVFKLRNKLEGMTREDIADLRKISDVLVATEYFIVPEAYIVGIHKVKTNFDVDMETVVKFLDACETVEIKSAPAFVGGDSTGKAPKLIH